VFIVFIKNKRTFLLWDDSKRQWMAAEPEDERLILREIELMFPFNKDNFANLVGFIGFDQKNTYLVFKIKDIQATRNTGARCDEAGKSKKIQIINAILGEEKFNKDNTKGMGQAELCSLIEMILRYYNNERKEQKLWFLGLDFASIYKFI